MKIKDILPDLLSRDPEAEVVISFHENDQHRMASANAAIYDRVKNRYLICSIEDDHLQELVQIQKEAKKRLN